MICDRSLPQEADSLGFRPVDEHLVQGLAPHPDAFADRERSIDFDILVQEADAAKGIPVFRPDRNAEAFEYLQAVGHQALSAGLVDGRPHAVGDGHARGLFAGRRWPPQGRPARRR